MTQTAAYETPAQELRAAADKLAPEPDQPPTLTGDYPDVDACYAHLLRSTADTCDMVVGYGLEVVEDVFWLAPALAAARKINGGLS